MILCRQTALPSLSNQVIERVERMAGASLYKGTRRVDLNRAAERRARELDATEAADSRLDIKVKIMVIGMTGGDLIQCHPGLPTYLLDQMDPIDVEIFTQAICMLPQFVNKIITSHLMGVEKIPILIRTLFVLTYSLSVNRPGTGKSEFINAMLERPAARTNAFSDTTKSIRVVRGSHRGIQVR